MSPHSYTPPSFDGEPASTGQSLLPFDENQPLLSGGEPPQQQFPQHQHQFPQQLPQQFPQHQHQFPQQLPQQLPQRVEGLLVQAYTGAADAQALWGRQTFLFCGWLMLSTFSLLVFNSLNGLGAYYLELLASLLGVAAPALYFYGNRNGVPVATQVKIIQAMAMVALALEGLTIALNILGTFLLEGACFSMASNSADQQVCGIILVTVVFMVAVLALHAWVPLKVVRVCRETSQMLSPFSFGSMA